LRRRIGRVEIFLRRDTTGDVEIDNPGSTTTREFGKSTSRNAIHSSQADDDSVFNGERAAAQACSGAARDERDSFTVTDSNDRLDLFRGIWQQDRARHDAEIGEAVALVGMKFFRPKRLAAVAGDRSKLIKGCALP